MCLLGHIHQNKNCMRLLGHVEEVHLKRLTLVWCVFYFLEQSFLVLCGKVQFKLRNPSTINKAGFVLVSWMRFKLKTKYFISPLQAQHKRWWVYFSFSSTALVYTPPPVSGMWCLHAHWHCKHIPVWIFMVYSWKVFLFKLIKTAQALVKCQRKA